MAVAPFSRREVDGNRRFASLEISLAPLADFAAAHHETLPFAEPGKFPEHDQWSAAGLRALAAGRRFRRTPVRVRGEDLQKISATPFEDAWRAWLLNAYVEIFRSDNPHMPIGCLGELPPRLPLDNLRGLRETLLFHRHGIIDRRLTFVDAVAREAVFKNIRKGLELAQRDNTVNTLEGGALPFACYNTEQLAIYGQTALARLILVSKENFPPGEPDTNTTRSSAAALRRRAAIAKSHASRRVSDVEEEEEEETEGAEQGGSGPWRMGLDEMGQLAVDVGATYYTTSAARLPMVRYNMQFAVEEGSKSIDLYGDVKAKAMHPRAVPLYGEGEAGIDPRMFRAQQEKIFQKGYTAAKKKQSMGIKPDLLNEAEVAAGKPAVQGYKVSEVTKGWSLRGMSLKNFGGLLLGAGGLLDLAYATLNKFTRGKFQGIIQHFTQAGVGDGESALMTAGVTASADLGITGMLAWAGLIGGVSTGFVTASAVAVAGLPIGAGLYLLHRDADEKLQKELDSLARAKPDAR